MRVRILVASQSEADFYDLDGTTEDLRPAGKMEDANARLHDRDLKSDRPGRVFDHAAAAHGRRGASAHHATGGERTPRRHEAESFAARIASELERAHRAGDFDGVVVMAGPMFLGLLRSALPADLRKAVLAEVPKDLIGLPVSAVGSHLPEL